MEKGIREKIALLIFIFLVVLGGCALAAYFATGRSWSVAATMVDDRVGEMDGYTAVVFSGTLDPRRSPSTSDDLASRQTNNGETLSVSEEAASDGLGSKVVELLHRTIRFKDYNGVYVSDVRDIYEHKNADVLTIDLTDPDAFLEPFVYDVKGRKIGVFSIKSYTTRAQLEKIVEDLHEQGAYEIICIAPRPNMLASFDGIDVVLLSKEVDEDLTAKVDPGQTLLYVTPDADEVGVVLFTSNGVASSRTIDEV